MKKLLSLSLSLVMILSVFIGGTVTAGAETYGVLTYEFKDGKITITGCDENASGEVVIPAEIDGYPVTSIGEKAFTTWTEIDGGRGTLISGRGNITSIIIPDSVTSIGDNAFEECYGLTSITIPGSVTSIGNYAFEGCSALTSVTISKGVTSIGHDAFGDCIGLTSIYIPDSVTSIGYPSFFDRCSSLESITVDENNPFYHSSGNCLIETASKRLISGCKNSVIPDDGSVTIINNCAFLGLPNYKNIYIPSSVTNIEFGAFQHCTGIESITVDENNPFYHSSGNCIIETASKTLVLGCKNSVIPDEGSVTKIGNDAFWDCPGLTSITIPDSVTSISDSAFCSCTGLTGITISDSVTSIGDWAFSGCAGLTSINIPDSVTGIGTNPFAHCTGLESITVDEGNTVYHSSGNCLIETGSQTLIAGCKNSVIPDDGSVTIIGEDAFYACFGLTSINIPDSVYEIEGYAFYDCSELKDVYYAGTEAQWNMIDIKEGNDNLLDAAPYPYNPDDSDNLTLYYSSNYMAIGHMYSVKPRIIILDEPLSNWTRDGYTFIGWALSSDANEAEYQPGDKYNLTEDTTFYAVWKPDNSDIPDDKDIVFESPEGVALYDDYSAKMPDGRTVKNAIDISVAENGVKFNLTQLTPQQDEGFGGIKYGCSCKFDLSLADPAAADISETNPATIRFKKDFIGRDIKNIVIFHYPAHGGRESFTSTKNEPDFRIYDDGEYWKITVTSLSPFGIYCLPTLNVKSSAMVDYKANVTVTAMAENVPEGYALAIYEGNALKAKGNTTSVSYKAGTMTAGRTFTVKITDSGNNALKDIEENEIKANCEVKVKSGFFDKLIAFFKGLFGLLPNVEIKP